MSQTTNTALLVMDMQSSILGMYPETATVISNVAKAIAAARKKNIPVIYAVLSFRQGAPEISLQNKGFSAISGKERWTTEFAEQWAQIHPDVAPQGDEVTVFKKRVSAFTGSDLEVVLRGQNVQHLVLTGIATSGIVLSTLREAADKDYELSVIADCCFDGDEEVHRVLTTKVFPRQADVISLEQWLQ